MLQLVNVPAERPGERFARNGIVARVGNRCNRLKIIRRLSNPVSNLAFLFARDSDVVHLVVALRGLLTGQKPSPGNHKGDNIAVAREQERQIRDWIRQAADYFQPIAPIPNTGNNAVSSEAFAGALRRTIDQLQHEADAASVTLPPQYNFSFKAQRDLVRFQPGSLASLAAQFGEVKTISEILFAARVNSLDGIQRVRVSDDDANGPQADYFDGHSVTNNLAVLTPYQITLRSFSPEVGEVLAGFALSPHGFIVKSINVQPAGSAHRAAGCGGRQRSPAPGRASPAPAWCLPGD